MGSVALVCITAASQLVFIPSRVRVPVINWGGGNKNAELESFSGIDSPRYSWEKSCKTVVVVTYIQIIVFNVSVRLTFISIVV